MVSIANGKAKPYSLAVESIEVRREYLRQGGRLRETARALGTSHQNVEQHIARANRIAPLAIPRVTLFPADETPAEDQAAIAAFVRASLERVGVLRNAPPAGAPPETPPPSPVPESD